MSDDWPSHHQEMTRKTADELIRISDRFNRGEITKREFTLLLLTLSQTTMGMIEQDLSKQIADLHHVMEKT